MRSIGSNAGVWTDDQIADTVELQSVSIEAWVEPWRDIQSHLVLACGTRGSPAACEERAVLVDTRIADAEVVSSGHGERVRERHVKLGGSRCTGQFVS